MQTTELDTLAAEVAASMTTIHPDYAILAARIEVSNLQKETKKLFSGRLYNLTLWSTSSLVYQWHFKLVQLLILSVKFAVVA